MKKTIIGICLFLTQIGLAIFYNPTVDTVIIMILAVLTFGYILLNNNKGKYESCEI